MTVKYLEALQAKSLGSIALLRGQSFSGITTTMAAALAANSTVCAARYPLAATGRYVLQSIHLHYVCLLSFTAPTSVGRRLALKRGSGGDPSGGAALDVMRNQSDGTETLLAGAMATTAALTMTGVSYETATRARMLLAHAGTAGQDYDEIWTFPDGWELLPGQLFGIVAPATWDAVGTWQLEIKGSGFEI